jgi:hypothetical protein
MGTGWMVQGKGCKRLERVELAFLLPWVRGLMQYSCASRMALELRMYSFR